MFLSSGVSKSYTVGGLAGCMGFMDAGTVRRFVCCVEGRWMGGVWILEGWIVSGGE